MLVKKIKWSSVLAVISGILTGAVIFSVITAIKEVLSGLDLQTDKPWIVSVCAIVVTIVICIHFIADYYKMLGQVEEEVRLLRIRYNAKIDEIESKNTEGGKRWE